MCPFRPSSSASRNSTSLKTGRELAVAALALAGMLVAPLAQAQVTVTGVTYSSVSDAADVTVNNITYQNSTYAVQTITTASTTYSLSGPQATNVFFRRNTSSSSPNNSTVLYQYSLTTGGSGSNVNTAAVVGTSDSTPTLAELMMSNDMTKGIRNPFANGTSSDSSNIERIDYYLPNYTVQANDALVFFDLENLGNFGDGFRIAAFTAVDGAGDLDAGTAGTPTTYASTGLLIAADSFGNPISAPGTTDARYLRATTTSGDNLNASQSLVTIDTSGDGTLNNNDLYLVGIVIRFSDLGIAAGTTIQGFSLMAGDVAVTTASSLVNWNNTSVYLNNTSDANYGNMDFMSFGSKVIRPVPESSTYGAIFMGLALAGWWVRRRITAKAA